MLAGVCFFEHGVCALCQCATCLYHVIDDDDVPASTAHVAPWHHTPAVQASVDWCGITYPPLQRGMRAVLPWLIARSLTASQ